MPDFYGTSAGFVTYHAERDNEIPIEIDTDEERETALLVASEWLDSRYKSLFEGLKTGARDQLREWPRVGHTDRYDYVIPGDEIPREIVNATYEIALKHLVNPNSLRIDYTPSKFTEVSIDGAVAAKFTQFNSSSDAQTQFQIVDEILSGLFDASSTGLFSSLSGSTIRV